MSLFAQIDGDRKVLRVVVCDSVEWLQERLGGTWVETTDANPGEQYAGPGMHDSEAIAPRRFIAPWRQPVGAEDAWPKGAWVWYQGRAWRNLMDANVWAPGVTGWREMLVEWPEWVQPLGAHDAYQIGEKVTFGGSRYVSTINANVWSPAVYPAGWQVQL